MRDMAAELVGRIVVGLATVGILAVFSQCTTKSDVEKNADGTCNLSQPREVTFKTYDSCGDECTRTNRHTYQIAAEKTPDGKEVVSISNLVVRPTTGFSAKGTSRTLSYEAGGRTLDASLTTQHNIMGYKTAPKQSSGDISALAPARSGDAAYKSGMNDGMKLIREIEKRAKCTMPKPSQAGVNSIGSW